MIERLVSVIIPAFNASSSVRKAIQSVLDQDHVQVETIVVDDGSTDSTPEVLSSFGNRIRWSRQENKGPAAARNRALSAAKGQYTMFLDADDAILPHKLSRQVGLLETSTAPGWTYCDVEYLDEEGHHVDLASNRFSYAKRARLDGFLFSELLLGNFIPVHAPLIRRGCLDAVLPFDEDPALIGVEDWDLFLRLGLHFEALYSHDVLATCLIRSGSLSSNPQARDRRRFHLLDKAIRTHAKEIGALGSVGRRVIADTHNWFGYRLYREGRYIEASKRLRQSVTAWPTQGRAWLYWFAARMRSAFPREPWN